jgi:hypothetical protein
VEERIGIDEDAYAIKFESIIKKHDITIKIIPVPRSISSSCGLCVRFDMGDKDKLEDIINKSKLEYSNLYTNI